MNYPTGYTEGDSKYSIFCTKCGNRKKRTKACKKCKESEYEIEFAHKSLELNNSILTRMETIQSVEEEYRMVQEKMAALEIQKNFLLNDLELKKIQLKIHELQGKYQEHIISDNIRKHYGTYEGKTVELETHCTIFRIDNSLEDVYFGHVTLVITYPKEVYKWHYGAEVYNKLPQNLEHKFWQTYVAGQIKYDAEQTNVSDMGRFEDIPSDMTLLDMMKIHFEECITFFNKRGWPPNQIWGKDSEYESEKATDRLSRLLSKLEELEQLKNQEIMQKYSHTEATEKVNRDREERKQKAKEQNIKREQEDRERRLKDINARIEQATEAAPKPAELTEVVETPKQAVSKEAPKQAELTEVVETPKQAVSKEAPKQAKVVETPKQAVSKEAPKQAKVVETPKQAVSKAAPKQAKVVETPKQAVSKAAPKPVETSKPDELTEVVETPKSAVSKAAPTPDETSKPAVAKTSHKQPKSVGTPKISDITEDTMVESLYKENKEKIEKNVENFLKEIEEKKDTDIKLITTRLVIEETQDINSYKSFKYRDRLIETYNDLIEFFDNMIPKIMKDINTLKEKDKKAQLLKIENSRATLMNLKNEVDKKNILQRIDKGQNLYKIFREKEERLLQAEYDYLKNTNTISDIEELIRFYTRYQERIQKYNSLNLSEFKPKDSAKIKADISNFEEMIKPEQHLEKLKFLKYLKNDRDLYYSEIIIKEKFLTDNRRTLFDESVIEELINFYTEYISHSTMISKQLSSSILNKKDTKKIDSSRLSLDKIVDAELRLKELKILTQIIKWKNMYYKDIEPKEKLLKTLYRREKEAIQNINSLIQSYRNYLQVSKKWSSKLSSLNEEDALKIGLDISDLNKLLNPERRLEELYMMQAHNIKEIFADIEDDFDEPKKNIISNISLLTNDTAEIISDLIDRFKTQQGFCSTKTLLKIYSDYFNDKKEERKIFLREDAKNIVNIFKQRKYDIKVKLKNMSPMIDYDLIKKFDEMYLEYSVYIDDLINEIQHTFDDDASKTEILVLLTNFASEKTLEID